MSVETLTVSRMPLSMTQRTAARRMLQSAQEIPQFSVTTELNGDDLDNLRRQINAGIANKEERISVTALLIWITAKALSKHPRMNGRFEGDFVLVNNTVNVAVAVDTPEGLTVPVIHRAQALSVHEISKALKDLVARAAKKRLLMGDFQGGTFTISNLGMLGVTQFTPLINPPQSAIMGVGALREAVQMDGDGVLKRTRAMTVTVTGDHRVLDGAEVARFLYSIRNVVQEQLVVGTWMSSGGIRGESSVTSQ